MNDVDDDVVSKIIQMSELMSRQSYAANYINVSPYIADVMMGLLEKPKFDELV